MLRTQEGFSLIELIIAMAVMGVLIGVGVSRLNPDGAATRQAAQVVAAAINRARYEAIRTNNTAGFNVLAAAGTQPGSVVICRSVDETVTLSCATGEVAETFDLATGDLGRARITSADLTVFFDRRGIVRNPNSVGQVVTITDRSGGNVRTVTILPTGRTEIN